MLKIYIQTTNSNKSALKNKTKHVFKLVESLVLCGSTLQLEDVIRMDPSKSSYGL